MVPAQGRSPLGCSIAWRIGRSLAVSMAAVGPGLGSAHSRSYRSAGLRRSVCAMSICCSSTNSKIEHCPAETRGARRLGCGNADPSSINFNENTSSGRRLACASSVSIRNAISRTVRCAARSAGAAGHGRGRPTRSVGTRLGFRGSKPRQSRAHYLLRTARLQLARRLWQLRLWQLRLWPPRRSQTGWAARHPRPRTLSHERRMLLRNTRRTTTRRRPYSVLRRRRADVMARRVEASGSALEPSANEVYRKVRRTRCAHLVA